jgi:hypothetical protein
MTTEKQQVHNTVGCIALLSSLFNWQCLVNGMNTKALVDFHDVDVYYVVPQHIHQGLATQFQL